MSLKLLKSRWANNPKVENSIQRIKQICQNGGVITDEDLPFDILEKEYLDLRGINLSQIKIKQVKFKKTDFSFSNFSFTWIEHSIFTDVNFKTVDFSEISDHGNHFSDCSFIDCKFSRAALGYSGTKFENCTFDDSSFMQTSFIRCEFSNCNFINCKLKGVDFSASSFEDCRFIGKVNDVWFRGNYGYSYGEKDFGKAKKNKMSNVSFEKASLIGLTFSNQCDLSSIKLPENGRCRLYNNWRYRLEELKQKINSWELNQKKEAEIFINSFLIHAKSQDWNLLNIEEVEDEFGVKLTEKLILGLDESK